MDTSRGADKGPRCVVDMEVVGYSENFKLILYKDFSSQISLLCKWLRKTLYCRKL
jgi:hypothetical protein